jgi:hypothetical protein
MRAAVLTLAFRDLAAQSADRSSWPTVAVHGIDEELLRMCGACDPAGHQALPLGGYPHAN